MFKFNLLILSLTFSLINAENKKSNSIPLWETEIYQETQQDQKLSVALGHLIGRSVFGPLGQETKGIDLSALITGLTNEAKGLPSPMSEEECINALISIQTADFEKKSEENLLQAERFLSINGGNKNVRTILSGKLQYRIDKPGKGPCIDEHSSPLIRYIGKCPDETIFGSSREEEVINLDETIPGFQQGIIGMKEGEKRTLYIHPDLGYGTSGTLPPNILLIFEVEVIKAHAPQIKPLDSMTVPVVPSDPLKKNPEIANPFIAPEVLR